VNHDKQWIGQQQGFTLIEVMFALFIFLIIALGLAQGEIVALRTQTDNLLRDQALRLAEAELYSRAGLDFGDIALTQAPWTNPPDQKSVEMRAGTVDFFQAVQITNVTGNLTLIEVAVGWNQGNNQPLLPTQRNHQISLATIIARQ